MPVMNFDLEDGLPPVSFSLKESDAERFVAFMAECDAALKSTAAVPAPAPLQHRVQPWMMECFGPTISADTQERNHRFLEEALELVQACGATQSEAHQLVDYVYGRPVGEKKQEAGGVMITLAALCLANGLDMHQAGEVELARIWTMVDQIRAKQAAKPKHSPLPAASHPDDLAVDRFAAAMKAKMAASRAKGRNGWDNPDLCPAERLQGMLLDHLAKGDPVDIGNFAMMLWNRGEPVAAAAPAAVNTAHEIVTDRDISELIGIAQFLQGVQHWEAQASSKLLAEFTKKLLDAKNAAAAPAVDDARDAARWRAFLGSARIRMLGSAGLKEPMPNNYAHLGMEIWTAYRYHDQAWIEESNELGREWLTKYADIAIEAQK